MHTWYSPTATRRPESSVRSHSTLLDPAGLVLLDVVSVCPSASYHRAMVLGPSKSFTDTVRTSSPSASSIQTAMCGLRTSPHPDSSV